ncbi:MAG: amidohydrolase family protein [Pseudomonadota bacterium]
MRTMGFLVIFFLSLSGFADAQKKALVGGTLLDGLGGPPIYDSVILVDGDRIEEVGNQDSLQIPDGYEVISTEAMTVMPGLWEMHAHLMLNGHSNYAHWDRTYVDRLEDEIMPASAVQLLLAGVTTARDLGAPLEPSLSVREQIASGEIPGPRLFVSGPFIQKQVYPGTEAFRWGVDGPRDAARKVNRLADAGVDIIKLIDHDLMTREEAEAVVDTAHERGLIVVGHSHKPDEIRIGLEIGIDNFEHTGLTTAPEYPADIMDALRERTARGRIAGGPLYWTPTIEGLWNYEETRANPEELDTDCWHRGLEPDTIADIEASIQYPNRLDYFQLTPRRRPTLQRKFAQLREAGVVQLIGTDSGIPLKFHCQSTWNEIDIWTRIMGVPFMEVLQAATYWPSKLMGVEDEWGTIVPGRYADIIAIEGDVTRYPALLQRVDFVMKGGVVYKEDGRPVEEALGPLALSN